MAKAASTAAVAAVVDANVTVFRFSGHGRLLLYDFCSTAVHIGYTAGFMRVSYSRIHDRRYNSV